MATKLNVTFESDIPKISREGSERRSKYDTLLDSIRDRAQTIKGKNKVAVLQFDAIGKATSRYTSVKEAVAKRDDAAHWTVAVRTLEEDDVRLYIQWNEEAQEVKPRKNRKAKAETPVAEPETETEDEDDEDEEITF